MRINLLKTIFLALVIVSAGCSPKENKDTKASAKSNSLNTYGGKWRYVHDGSELYIGNKNIDKIYFLPTYEKSAPEQFEGYGHYVFSPVDENLLVQKRKNNTDIYLVRDGIKNTVVKGQIASPQASLINIPKAFTSSKLSGIGDLSTVLKNIKTDDIISIKADVNGKISSNNIPTGNYEVTVGDTNSGFKDTLEVGGLDTDLGVLNLANKNGLNFKAKVTISKEIFKEKTSNSKYTGLNSNDVTYDYHRGQYIFPLGDIQRTEPAEKLGFQDPAWITINIKNISGNFASGVVLKIQCKDLEWVIDCGRTNNTNLIYDVGTLKSGEEHNATIWLHTRPFNAERKDLVIPISISTSDHMQWNDTVTIAAYKKPQIVKISMAEYNTGYIFLPGRNSIKLSSTHSHINLPFINGNVSQLLYSNNSQSRQTNYSISNGKAINPTDRDTLKLDQGWSRNFEPANDMESTAPLIQQGDVIDAYLHQGDLDFYKIIAKDEISITAIDEVSKSVLLNDKPVSAHTLLSFKASSLVPNETATIQWLQVRGPKVDLAISTDGSTASFVTPSFSEKETLTFKVYYNAQKGHEVFDYLSVTINPFTTATVQTAENTDKDLHNSANTNSSNLILNYSNVKDANNTFTINQSINLNTLTISEGVTLIIEEGNTLTIQNHLFAAGSKLHVKGTLNLSSIAQPVLHLPTDLTLDGTLTELTQDLVINGSVTHSAGSENGLTLKTSGKLSITNSGKIDVTAKGLTADKNATTTCKYYKDNVVAKDNECSNFSGGTHATNGINNRKTSTTTPTYGNAAMPSLLGGSGYGAAGGGYINIQAADLENNGAIIADGESTSYSAGAGGSILIKLKSKVTGSGSIKANGGSATSSSYHAKGGLGRIAIKGYKEITLSLDNIKDYGSLWLQPDGATGGDIYLPVDTTWNVYEDTTVNKIVSDAQIEINVNNDVTYLNIDKTKQENITVNQIP